MPKRINKKMFLLLFVIATLTQPGSTMPMIYKMISCLFCLKKPDPCEQPSTGTTIQKLPSDCLHKIFRFAQLGSLVTLRLISKDFKQAVSCFHAPYPVEVDCENQKISWFPGEVFGAIETLIFKNFDFKKTKIVWPNNLQTLFIFGCRNCDSISTLKSNKLQKLQVDFCHNFDGTFLNGLTNLCELTVFFCFGFDNNSDIVKQLRKNKCKVNILGCEPWPDHPNLSDYEQPKGLLGWLTGCWADHKT